MESDDGQTVTQAHDIANTLAKKFQENSNNINSPHPTIIYNSIHHDLIHNENNSILNSPLTLKEINSTLASTKNSAPGPDNFPNLLLEMLPETGINYLLKIFNCIWIHKVFPENWQKAIVVLIPKPNKCKLNPNSYRPIALTNTMCRLLEKIVNRRLRWYVEVKTLLNPNQYGFRHYRSTTDVLTNLETNICDAFLNKEYIAAVCLHIEKAFDIISRTKIINALIELKVNGQYGIFHNQLAIQ